MAADVGGAHLLNGRGDRMPGADLIGLIEVTDIDLDLDHLIVRYSNTKGIRGVPQNNVCRRSFTNDYDIFFNI